MRRALVVLALLALPAAGVVASPTAAAGVAALRAAAAGATAAAGITTPTPAPTPAVPPALTDEGPDREVAFAYFSREGADVVRNSANNPVRASERSKVNIGVPVVRLARWSREYRVGVPESPIMVYSAQWAAPALLDNKPMGVLVITVEGGRVTGHFTDWDREIAESLMAPIRSTFVREAEGNNWFRVVEGKVSAVNGNARKQLAGPVDLEIYGRQLSQRNANSPGASPEKPAAQPSGLPVVVTAGLLLGVLLVAGFVVWLRREDENA